MFGALSISKMFKWRTPGCVFYTYYHLGIKGWYLPLLKVADAIFQYQCDKIVLKDSSKLFCYPPRGITGKKVHLKKKINNKFLIA